MWSTAEVSLASHEWIYSLTYPGIAWPTNAHYNLVFRAQHSATSFTVFFTVCPLMPFDSVRYVGLLQVLHHLLGGLAQRVHQTSAFGNLQKSQESHESLSAKWAEGFFCQRVHGGMELFV